MQLVLDAVLALYQGTTKEAAEKPAIGQERRTSGPKGRRIFSCLWPD
jgi:hypothetical protein